MQLQYLDYADLNLFLDSTVNLGYTCFELQDFNEEEGLKLELEGFRRDIPVWIITIISGIDKLVRHVKSWWDR